MSDELQYQIFKRKFLEKHPEAEENLIRGFYLKFKKETGE
jgi:hypothetical protein